MEGLRVSKLEEGQQWGKNTSSRDEVEWGRRPPYIVGGTIQPLPPLQPRRERYYRLASGTTACHYKRYYRPKARYYRWAHNGTTSDGGRYYRTGAVLRPPTAAASTVKPDTKKEPSNRGGTSTRPPRYYGLGPLAVLLLWSGTTAPRAVLPLVAPKRYYRSVPRYHRWDQR